MVGVAADEAIQLGWLLPSVNGANGWTRHRHFWGQGWHIFDPVSNSIGLHAPVSVGRGVAPPNKWNWALDRRFITCFLERTDAEKYFAGELV